MSINESEKTMKVWKCRCECVVDGFRFMEGNMRSIPKFTMKYDGYLGATLEFETFLCLSDIKRLLDKVPDSHVMLQTLRPIELYTGERW
jgi:hypothetical protein